MTILQYPVHCSRKLPAWKVRAVTAGAGCTRSHLPERLMLPASIMTGKEG